MARVKIEMKEKVNVRTAEQWFPGVDIDGIHPYGDLLNCRECELNDAPKAHAEVMIGSHWRSICPGDWLIYSDDVLIAIQGPMQFEKTFNIVEEKEAQTC